MSSTKYKHRSSSNLGGSSLEGPSLVSSSSKDVEGLSTTHPSTGVSAAEGGSTEGGRNNPSVSLVTCLRKSDTESTSFLQKLQTSCLPPGG